MELGNFLAENQQKSSLASNVLAHFYCPWRGSQRGMGNPDHGNPVVPEEALLDFRGTALGDARKGFIQKEDGFSLGQQPKQGLHDFHINDNHPDDFPGQLRRIAHRIANIRKIPGRNIDQGHIKSRQKSDRSQLPGLTK